MATPMDKDFLADCLGQGMSLPEIGRLAGRAPGTVGYWVRRHGLTANGSIKFRPGKGLRREPLESLVREGRTLGQIAAALEVSMSTVRYWIARYQLPEPREIRSLDKAERLRTGDTRAVRPCKHHGETEFTLDRTGWRCRRCRSLAVSERRRKMKRILVDEAGGQCRICGYDRTYAALQFHHLDPAEKRFNLSQQGHTRGIAAAREEAAKCILVCSNCHAEIESGSLQIPPASRNP